MKSLLGFFSGTLILTAQLSYAQDVEQTDFGDSYEVRGKLVQGLNDVVQDACTDKENVVLLCVQVLKPTEGASTTCLPTDRLLNHIRI